jgi:precorrin-3B methylase
MSSKLVLQMLQAGPADLTGSFNHLHVTAELEFDLLVDIYQGQAEADNGTLTALEGYHVFSIAVYNVSRRRSENRLRQCIDILTAISQRFSGIRSLRNALYRFIDLAANDRMNAEMKILQLDHELQQLDGTVTSRHQYHMRSILIQLAEDQQATTRGHGRRETMPSI